MLGQLLFFAALLAHRVSWAQLLAHVGILGALLLCDEHGARFTEKRWAKEQRGFLGCLEKVVASEWARDPETTNGLGSTLQSLTDDGLLQVSFGAGARGVCSFTTHFVMGRGCDWVGGAEREPFAGLGLVGLVCWTVMALGYPCNPRRRPPQPAVLPLSLA